MANIATGVVSGPNSFVAFAVNSSGNPNMNVDGSETPVEYRIDVPSGYRLGATCIKIILGFTAAEGKIDLFDFGNLPPLTNGVEYHVFHYETGEVDVTGDYPWKTNADLMVLSASGRPLTSYQLDGDAILVFHYPLIPWIAQQAVIFDAGESMHYVVQDDLSSISLFRTTVFGTIIPDKLA